MLPVISLFILAFALSLDGFGVGVMYGLRNIKIPFLSVAIISCCSGLVIFVSMQIGVYLAQYLSPVVAQSLGGLILIGIGTWAVLRIVWQKDNQQEPAAKSVKIIYIEFKRLGLVIQILKTPSLADMDKSGIISASEAMLLGIALSLDAFGAGIGAAFIGFSPMITAVVIALSSGVVITIGLRIGLIYSQIHWIRRMSILPGCVLILMGILKLM